MIELGDLVLFTPSRSVDAMMERYYGGLRDLYEVRMKCGIVIKKEFDPEHTFLTVVFSNGSHCISDDQLTLISKWYVASEKKCDQGTRNPLL